MYLFVKLELILVAITNKETNNFTLYLRHHRHLINNNTTRNIKVSNFRIRYKNNTTTHQL